VQDYPIGRRVRELRLRRGMSQDVVAGLVGKSERWLIGVEGGRDDVKVSDLVKLAGALRVRPEELLAPPDGLRVAEPAPSPVLRRYFPTEGRARSQDTRWGTRVGSIWFPWVVAGYGPYRPENIETYFHADEPEYPPDVEEGFLALRDDIRRRGARGEDVPYDSDDFKLLRFHVSSRTHGYEEPRLVLHFGPTTYFRMLATDQRLDVPLTSGGRTYTLRERYAPDVDLRVKPVPELATHWGVGLSVVTADGLLLVSERGNTAVDPQVFFPSVAEGTTRMMDGDPASGAPRPLSTAMRGMTEELGISLEADELTWLSFGANSYLCEYALIGLVRTASTFAEIEDRRSVGAAKDHWETRRLHGVEFTPSAVAAFCAQPARPFSAFGLIAIVHALMYEHGIGKVERAFTGIRVAVTQRLPDWLAGHPEMPGGSRLS
jgi:transcriptional regulator with XRE-family HTH domain